MRLDEFISILTAIGYELPDGAIAELEQATRFRKSISRRVQEKFIVAMALVSPADLRLPFDEWTTRRLGHLALAAGMLQEYRPTAVHVVISRILRDNIGDDYLQKLPYWKK